MNSNFTFPPPPPPPPRQAQSGGQYNVQQQYSRGGRGGQRSDHRGRGNFRSRGQSRGFNNHGPHHQQHAFNQPQAQAQPQSQAWMNNLNDWAAQQTQNIMGMYGLQSMPTYAQSLPQFMPNTSDGTQSQSQSAVYQHNEQPDQPQGVKRKREVKPREPAAPPVPSFGAPIPSWRPKSSEGVSSLKNSEQPSQGSSVNRRQKKKKQNGNNQLGLTPHGEDRDDTDDDENEEARLAAIKRTGPITVLHNNKATVLATPEDLKGWIDERKKKFPTQSRMEEKKKEDAQIAQERNKIQAEQREARRRQQDENRQKRSQKKERQNPQIDRRSSQSAPFTKPPNPKHENAANTSDSTHEVQKVDSILNGTSTSAKTQTARSPATGSNAVEKSHTPAATRPAEQKANKLERLQAKAEKYRKLAAEAEVSALRAKATALGYSLVKTEPNDHATPPKPKVKVEILDNNMLEEHLPGLGSGPSEQLLKHEPTNEDFFTIDVKGDESMRITNGSLPVLTPDVPPSNSESTSSSSSSSSSVSSFDDSLSDSSSEGEIEEHHPAPSQSTVPQSAQPERKKKKKPCMTFKKHGTCRFGDNCRFSHDPEAMQQQQRRDKMKEEPRMGLHERLLEQQHDEQNALVLNAIKFLGERGLLSEAADEGGAAAT